MCGWMGRAHPGAFLVGVILTGARPVEDGRCLACGQPEAEAACRVVEIGPPLDAVPTLTVHCRTHVEQSRSGQDAREGPG